MPGYYDRLHASEAGRKSGENSGRSIMAMDYIGRGAPERSV